MSVADFGLVRLMAVHRSLCVAHVPVRCTACCSYRTAVTYLPCSSRVPYHTAAVYISCILQAVYERGGGDNEP